MEHLTDLQLAETVEYVALRRLQNAYADVVTRRAWPELVDLFLPDATITVDTRTGDPHRFTGPEELGRFIAGAIERFEFFEFVILNTRLHIPEPGTGPRATGRMYMCELRQDASNGRRTNAFGVYHDIFERTADGWRFADRRYHSLARTAADTDVFPVPEIDL